MDEEITVTSSEEVMETKSSGFLPRKMFGLQFKHGLKFISSLLLPLVLGVFTSIIAIQQQKLARQQRNEDRTASQLHLNQQKTLDTERYNNEIFDTYIREMAILLKENNGSLTDNDVTAIVARVKTLNIFRKLDSQRNARIIRFLHEAKQLPVSETHRAVDLSTTNLNDSEVRCASNRPTTDLNDSETRCISNRSTANLNDPETRRAFDLLMAKVNDSEARRALNLLMPKINDSETRSALDLSTRKFNNSETRRALDLSTAKLNAIDFRELAVYEKYLLSVKFRNTSMFNTNFRGAITNKADFASVDLSNSTFVNADIQGASFIGSDLNNVNFSEANLYKVDLTNAKITEKQLQSAISIHEALLPNGTLAHDSNFLNNGQTGCNMSFGDNWILHKGNITTEISHIDPNNCYFFLRSYNNGAIMSRRVDLTKSDLESWPHSQIVLSANMSIGVSIQLKVTNSTEDINIHPRLVIPQILSNARWKQDGMCVAGCDGKGNATNQLQGPYNLFIVQDETMIIVDSENNRVIQWKIGDTNGQVLAGGNETGNKLNQLNYPSDVVIDKWTDSFIVCNRFNRQVVRWYQHNGIMQGESLINGINCYGLAIDDQEFLYISDMEKHVVKRYQMPNMTGCDVAGGNGKGDHNNQLYIPTFIFVDQKQSVYVSDNRNHRVMKWEKDAKEGIVVAGGNGDGGALTQLSSPNVVIVDNFGTVYVADAGNHRIMRWPRGATQGIVIVGGKRPGSDSNQLYAATGISFDRRGNLYVADTQNHRIQRFLIE
ncbi:unnamed protein product [Adineta steineri]|uniref:Uncharacterized protein n=1 Tax=Adineta steineri TaxID=433720 RepID=A0A814ESI1_9BILA|nr:unnamed protein product [Adineta steineri]